MKALLLNELEYDSTALCAQLINLYAIFHAISFSFTREEKSMINYFYMITEKQTKPICERKRSVMMNQFQSEHIFLFRFFFIKRKIPKSKRTQNNPLE